MGEANIQTKVYLDTERLVCDLSLNSNSLLDTVDGSMSTTHIASQSLDDGQRMSSRWRVVRLNTDIPVDHEPQRAPCQQNVTLLERLITTFVDLEKQSAFCNRDKWLNVSSILNSLCFSFCNHQPLHRLSSSPQFVARCTGCLLPHKFFVRCIGCPLPTIFCIFFFIYKCIVDLVLMLNMHAIFIAGC